MEVLGTATGYGGHGFDGFGPNCSRLGPTDADLYHKVPLILRMVCIWDTYVHISIGHDTFHDHYGHGQEHGSHYVPGGRGFP